MQDGPKVSYQLNVNFPMGDFHYELLLCKALPGPYPGFWLVTKTVVRVLIIPFEHSKTDVRIVNHSDR